MKQAVKTIERLQRQNQILTRALRFYADSGRIASDALSDVDRLEIIEDNQSVGLAILRGNVPIRPRREVDLGTLLENIDESRDEVHQILSTLIENGPTLVSDLGLSGVTRSESGRARALRYMGDIGYIHIIIQSGGHRWAVTEAGREAYEEFITHGGKERNRDE